jgi:dihydroneopterin triphosphate diphosphatase
MKVVSTLIEAHVFRKTKDDIEFLLIKRSENDDIYPGMWQMVTGSINKNEKAFQTAMREIKEETGLTPVQLWAAPLTDSFYNPEKDFINMIPVFAALVDFNAKVILSEEHSDFMWVSKEDAQRVLPWKGQRISVETIYEYFTMELSNLNLVEIKLDK